MSSDFQEMFVINTYDFMVSKVFIHFLIYICCGSGEHSIKLP